MQDPITWKDLRQTSLGRRLLAIVAICLLAVLLSIACAMSYLDKAQDAQAQYQQVQTEISELQDKLDGQTKSLERLNSLSNENSELKIQIETLQSTADSQTAQLAEKDSYITQLEAKLSAASAPKSGGSNAVSTATGGGSGGETKSQTVYITKTGSKYHRSGCQYLKKSKISISLSDAKAKGYTACSKCY